ncbi:MAG: hypothetical protein HUJ63_04510, partial [Enterococcus sp.]|nr:hypothetical protein [Enterococcus sp.]
RAITKYSKNKLPLGNMQYAFMHGILAHKDQLSANIPYLIQLNEDIDLQKFIEALKLVVSTHSIFAVEYFKDSNGYIFQKYSPTVPEIKIEELSDQKFQEISNDLVKPFKPFKERMYRLRVFKTQKHSYFFVDIHHSIVDGLSFMIFFENLSRAYYGGNLLVEDKDFFDFVADELELKKTQKYKQAQNWIKEEFTGAQANKIPNRSRSSNLSTLENYNLDISYSNLLDFCYKNNVTVNTLIIATYVLAVSKLANSTDICFVTLFQGREDYRFNNTMGIFAREVFVRVKFSHDMKVLQFIKHVGHVLFQSFRNSIVGLDFKYGLPPCNNLVICQEAIEADISSFGKFVDKNLIPGENRQEFLVLELQAFFNSEDDSAIAKLVRWEGMEDASNKEFFNDFNRILQEILVKDNIDEICFFAES